MMANGNVAPPDAQYAALQQRVTGIEHSISGLSAQLTSLSTKLDERGKTPWATIIAAMGVVLAIVVAGGQLAKAPLDQSISRLERDVDLVRESVVPRGEHERVWANSDARYLEVNRRVDELKATMAGIFGVDDVIREILEDQKAIKRDLYRIDRGLPKE